MNELARVLAEKYPKPARPARLHAAAAPPARASPMVPQILATAARSNAPNGRLSVAPSDYSFGWWWAQGELGDRARAEVIRACRLADLADTDVAGAKRDLVALANPGHVFSYEGSERNKARAEREIGDLEGKLGDYATFEALIDNQLGEVYLAGASSLEWYPDKGRNGVAGVEVVPAEEIVIRRAGDVRQFVQQVYGAVLDDRTFIYSPCATRGRDPYGTPAIVAVLGELARKENLTNGADKVINLLSEGAFLQLGVPKPTPSELGLVSERDPGYPEALTAWYTAYIEIATQARERGVMVTEQGVDSKAIPLTGNVSGLSELEAANNLKVWSGVMTLPFMRGKMDSTTQALAEVVYPILLAHAGNMQGTVKRAVEFGLNLHLRLVGVAATVSLEFGEPSNPFKLSHAQAGREQAQTDAIYSELYGDEYVRWMASRDGFDPDKVIAWREQNRPAAPKLGLTGAEQNATPQGGDQNAPAQTNPQP